jgi:hypothetical protein
MNNPHPADRLTAGYDGVARICFHGRPLSICAVCAPEAERLVSEARAARVAEELAPKKPADG